MTFEMHTQGPWRVGIEPSGAQGALRVFAGKQASICGVFLMQREADANARLIAAAPELLEALRDCLAFLERDMPIASSGPERRKAAEAIAKATGAAA
jgi:hypothetical protein